MKLFLLTFLSIYGSAHLYLLLKARSAFRLGSRPTAGLALGLAAMVLAPVLVRVSERAGFEGVARLAAVIGYGWMGLIFYFVVVGLGLDCLRLVFVLLSRLGGRAFTGLRLSPRICFVLPMLAAVAVCSYGWFEARDICLHRVEMVSDKLPPGTDLRLVQISDVHLGLLVGGKRLAAILAQVRAARPDLLVATGDLVDGQMDNSAGLADQFQAIQPRYGKYAILGNHEFYAGLDHSLDFFSDAGFVVLRNEARPVGPALLIAGVDDRRAGTWRARLGEAESNLLAGLPVDRFVLLLKHRPQVASKSLGHFDLQLSGHVHQGQIFPFGLITKRFFPVAVGRLVSLAQGSIYVSPGSGTWGPPFRVQAPPEVTLIELKGPAVAAR